LKRHGSKLLQTCFAVCFVGIFANAAPGETISLPLSRTNGWQFLTYRKIPKNTFRATASGLNVGVTNSAAPAVFPLTNSIAVAELRVSGDIFGSLKVSPERQGKKGFDDYTLRVGLVESGPRTLSWREKIIAADWVKKLFALAPHGTGIGKIHFFNIGTSAKQIGKTRVHSTSELMEETVVAMPDAKGHVSFTNHFAIPMNTIAIWISCDGDDTKSSFAATLSAIELLTENVNEKPQAARNRP
jgi:hypothetical protein